MRLRVTVEKSEYRSFNATVLASMPELLSRMAVRCERRSNSRCSKAWSAVSTEKVSSAPMLFSSLVGVTGRGSIPMDNR
ncbi:hypothetical protein D3C73_1611240 [compost metagenome]